MQAQFEGLLAQMEQHYQQKHYHLLLGNLKLCVALLAYEGIYLSGEGSAALQRYLLTLDDTVREYHFRNALNTDILHALESTFLTKGQKDMAASWTQLKKTKLFNSAQRELPWLPLQNKLLYNFKSFFDEEAEKPDAVLKAQQAKRLTHWHQNTPPYQHQLLAELILGYWRTLKGQCPAVFQASSIEALLCLGEDLVTLQKSEKEESDFTLWPSILMLLQLLTDRPVANESAYLSGFAPSEFRAAFVLQELAQRCTARLTENEIAALLKIALDLNQSLSTLPLLKTPQSLLYDYTSQLAETRQVFRNLSQNSDPSSIFHAQKQHTQDVLALLNTLITKVIEALGKPPCDISLCVLGSTSRGDRRPYSDVEFLLLYKLREEEIPDRARLVTYLYHVFDLFELLLFRLGETPDPEHHQANAGFHLDSSSHVLHKGLWGTPEEIFKEFIEGIMSSSSKDVPHPWVHDESFYALLQPVLVQSDHPASIEIFKDYQRLIKKFLNSEVLQTDHPHRLEQATGLSCIGLKRHQAIAWACLKDVTDKSIKERPKWEVGNPINIKDSYYKPLAYLALNLKLFYQLETLHPAESLAAISSTYAWGRSLIQTLFTAALSWITQLQITLHMEKGYQEEELVYQPPKTEAEQELWAGLALLECGLLQPLYKLLKRYEQEKSFPDLKDITYSLLRSYLCARKPWMEHWKTQGMQSTHLWQHPLIHILETTPSPDGWSPHYQRVMAEHLQGLLTLTTSRVSACRVEGLPTRQKVMYLPESLVKQWFDAKGTFQGESAYSGKMSQVRRVEWNHRVWYVKHKAGNQEGLMGREFAVQTLHLLLGGEHSIALGWPMKLTYTRKGCLEQSYYVWISQEVAGRSLAEVMQKSPQSLEAKAIEAENYSQHFVLAYLTCPEDGQPENFKVQMTAEGLFKLLAIDMGHSFVNTRQFQNSKPVLNIKTMIYLLSSLRQPLAPHAITSIKLLEEEAWFAHWQGELNYLNKLFKPLLEAPLKTSKVPSSEWEKYNRLIDLSDHTLQYVRQRFHLFQRWLLWQEQSPTGQQVLERLDPVVAISYQSLQGKIKTPEDFYAIDPRAYVKDPSTGKMYSSITFKQIQQYTLTPEEIQESFQLNADYFETIDFNAMRHPNGTVDEARQRFALALLTATAKKAGHTFIHLNLLGCEVMKEAELISILQQLPHLQELHIEHCPWFDVYSLMNVLGHRYNYGALELFG